MKNNNKIIAKNNKSNGFSIRPKRCHICQKMFNPEKYDQHFTMCYRFQKEKVDNQTQSIKKQRIKTRSTPMREIINKGNAYKVIQPKSNFRIKNIPSSLLKNETLKQQTKRQNIFNPQSQKKLRMDRQTNKFNFNNKELEKQQTNISKSKTIIRNERKVLTSIKQQQKKGLLFKEQEIQDKSRTIRRQKQKSKEKQQSVTLPQYEPIQIVNYQSQHQLQTQNYAQSQNQQSQSQLSQQNNPVVIQQVAHNHTFIDPINYEDNQESQLNNNNQFPNLLQVPRSSNSSSFIAQLVSNTAQIINFIQRLNINDQTLDIMVQQLNHVNQIAQQVVQLNTIGHTIGITMETIFGPRIQQLQTAIISQVSIAILRSFNNRLSSQFQELIDRNPTLRNGFRKQQIKNNFKAQKCKKQGECPICLQQYPKETLVIQLQCHHTFHDECIQNWLDSSKNCPMCRKQQKLIG